MYKKFSLAMLFLFQFLVTVSHSAVLDDVKDEILVHVLSAKTGVGQILVGALGIFTLMWGITIFKASLDGKAERQYNLDNEIDDYLSTDDPDDYFSRYGAD